MRAPLFILTVIILAALIGPLLLPWSYDAIDWNAVRVPPLSPGHLLGTDSIGRDLLARTLVRRLPVRGRVVEAAVAAGATAEVRLAARDTGSGERVRLRLLFDGVEEYRFQRRPGPGLERLRDVQVGFFGDLAAR